MKLLRPTQIQRLLNKPMPRNVRQKAIIEYIDLLHSQIMDYQLLIDNIMSATVADNKDVQYSKDIQYSKDE